MFRPIYNDEDDRPINIHSSKPSTSFSEKSLNSQSRPDKISKSNRLSSDSEDEKGDKYRSSEILSDSSSNFGSEERCAICLGRIKGDVGSPDAVGCDHFFCLLCILEWAKNNTTCPQDRRHFNKILVRHSVGGSIAEKIPVEVKKDEEFSDFFEDNPTFCEVCGSSEREDCLLLCDGCDLGYHLECLTPPLSEVPVEEWFCQMCIAADLPKVVGQATLSNNKPNQRSVASRPRTRMIPRTRATERVLQRITLSRRKEKKKKKKKKRRQRSPGSEQDSVHFKRARPFGSVADSDIDAFYNEDKFADKLLNSSSQARKMNPLTYLHAPSSQYRGRSYNPKVEECQSSASSDILSNILDNQSNLLSSELSINNNRSITGGKHDFYQREVLDIPLPDSEKPDSGHNSGDEPYDPLKEYEQENEMRGKSRTEYGDMDYRSSEDKYKKTRKGYDNYNDERDYIDRERSRKSDRERGRNKSDDRRKSHKEDSYNKNRRSRSRSRGKSSKSRSRRRSRSRSRRRSRSNSRRGSRSRSYKRSKEHHRDKSYHKHYRDDKNHHRHHRERSLSKDRKKHTRNVSQEHKSRSNHSSSQDPPSWKNKHRRHRSSEEREVNKKSQYMSESESSPSSGDSDNLNLSLNNEQPKLKDSFTEIPPPLPVEDKNSLIMPYYNKKDDSFDHKSAEVCDLSLLSDEEENVKPKERSINMFTGEYEDYIGNRDNKFIKLPRTENNESDYISNRSTINFELKGKRNEKADLFDLKSKSNKLKEIFGDDDDIHHSLKNIKHKMNDSSKGVSNNISNENNTKTDKKNSESDENNSEGGDSPYDPCQAIESSIPIDLDDFSPLSQESATSSPCGENDQFMEEISNIEQPLSESDDSPNKKYRNSSPSDHLNMSKSSLHSTLSDMSETPSSRFHSDDKHEASDSDDEAPIDFSEDTITKLSEKNKDLIIQSVLKKNKFSPQKGKITPPSKSSSKVSDSDEQKTPQQDEKSFYDQFASPVKFNDSYSDEVIKRKLKRIDENINKENNVATFFKSHLYEQLFGNTNDSSFVSAATETLFKKEEKGKEKKEEVGIIIKEIKDPNSKTRVKNDSGLSQDHEDKNSKAAKNKTKRTVLEAKVVDEAKKWLNPYYQDKCLSKDEYKEIIIKIVNKVLSVECGMKVESNKIKKLVDGYVKKYLHERKKKKKQMQD